MQNQAQNQKQIIKLKRLRKNFKLLEVQDTGITGRDCLRNSKEGDVLERSLVALLLQPGLSNRVEIYIDGVLSNQGW